MVCAGHGDSVQLIERVASTFAIAPVIRFPCTYTYDLGACWEHEITLETTVLRDHSQDYPVCVEFRGDSPACDDQTALALIRTT